jgi:hypothetical protein
MWLPAYDGDDNGPPHSDTSGANQLDAGAAASRDVLNMPQNTEWVRLEGVRRHPTGSFSESTRP